jgi:prevent-host-death family protein
MWAEQEARERLAEVLQRAEAGEPQFVGETGVVISRAEYARLKAMEADETHPGRWLVKHFAGLGEIQLPSREDSRPIPFADWRDEDFGLCAEVSSASIWRSHAARMRQAGARMDINDNNRSSILDAIQEFDRREQFLTDYGFSKARDYWLIYQGRRYDSKAIVGVGCKYVPGSTGPLTAYDFSGGRETVQPLLEKLGFEVEVRGAAGANFDMRSVNS